MKFEEQFPSLKGKRYTCESDNYPGGGGGYMLQEGEFNKIEDGDEYYYIKKEDLIKNCFDKQRLKETKCIACIRELGLDE
jgi:hypothetical protein